VIIVRWFVQILSQDDEAKKDGSNVMIAEAATDKLGFLVKL
jgi:hypothetical protein